MNNSNTKELRKELGLPITKRLRYMETDGKSNYIECAVIGFEVAEYYEPSHTASLNVTLSTGEEVRILAPFFAHMQQSSFVQDMVESQDEQRIFKTVSDRYRVL